MQRTCLKASLITFCVILLKMRLALSSHWVQWVHEHEAYCRLPTVTMQHRVNTFVVSLAIPVDVLPLTLTNWMDHRPILPTLSRWSQERASQPGKIELVTSYKNALT
jgi:hypothetical protein